MTSTRRTTDRLRKRSDFLRLRNAATWRTPAFILVCGSGSEIGERTSSPPRVGYTVTKKLGNAVRRNRIKRRLRGLVRENASLFLDGHDYILIARPVAYTRSFDEMGGDIRLALQRVHGKLEAHSV